MTQSHHLVSPSETLASRFSLQESVAIVTGAGGLLGREHCKALGEAGARVIAVDICLRSSHATAAAVRETCGARVEPYEADITSREQLDSLRRALVSRYGRIDVLVNNAALNDKVEEREPTEPVEFEDFPLALWQRTLDVNLTGTFLCCQVFGSEMRRARRGSIVNIASTYGVVGPDQRIYRDATGKQTLIKSPAYSATKAALIGLTKYLAAYYGPSGVRVNSVSPGGTRNGQDMCFVANYESRTPLGRMARVDDFHGAILFLSSDAGSYVTGANIVVDGGWTAW